MTIHDNAGECVTDAILGPYGLAEELAHLPPHSTIKITRLDDWEENKPNG